jgi:hypothetical protein
MSTLGKAGFSSKYTYYSINIVFPFHSFLGVTVQILDDLLIDFYECIIGQFCHVIIFNHGCTTNKIFLSTYIP